MSVHFTRSRFVQTFTTCTPRSSFKVPCSKKDRAAGRPIAVQHVPLLRRAAVYVRVSVSNTRSAESDQWSHLNPKRDLPVQEREVPHPRGASDEPTIIGTHNCQAQSHRTADCAPVASVFPISSRWPLGPARPLAAPSSPLLPLTVWIVQLLQDTSWCIHRGEVDEGPAEFPHGFQVNGKLKMVVLKSKHWQASSSTFDRPYAASGCASPGGIVVIPRVLLAPSSQDQRTTSQGLRRWSQRERQTASRRDSLNDDLSFFLWCEGNRLRCWRIVVEAPSAVSLIPSL